jgi:hypothetical protein
MAGVTGNVSINVSIGNNQIAVSAQLADDASIIVSPVTALPVAQAGTITAGTATMASAGHGIETADTVTAFWTESGVSKYRYGCVVGTVNGTAVPLSGGAGDTLPGSGAAIVLGVEHAETASCDGDYVTLAAAGGQRAGYARVINESGSVLSNGPIGPEALVFWYAASGLANPYAGELMAQIFFANGDVSYTNEVTALVLYDNE